MANLLFADPAGRSRLVRRAPGFAGSLGAIVLFCVSMTPSLLPRDWLLQGVVSGLTMAIGYGAGATIGAVVRASWPRLPAVPRWAWWVLAGAGGTVASVFLWLGESWQREVRQLVGADPDTGWHPVLIGTVALAVLTLLLAAARGLRLGTRRLAATLGRFSPRPVASVAAVGLVAALSYGVGQGVVFNGFVETAEQMAAEANDTTAPGVYRPDSPYVSGGPGSLVPWDTLGAYGREFTAGAVSTPQLAAFAGAEAPGPKPPIRVYVGRESAEEVDARAALAVRELERTGALDRSVLAVVTTTGTGWVNPAVPTALEYMHSGDTAVVAMQYSYLPSWISFVADRSSVTEASTALIGAIQERLDQLPADQRPELVIYGESLGAQGTEEAFGGLEQMLESTDGVLLAGPPHTNPIWREVTGDRDPASPVWRPVHDRDELVRFGQVADDLPVADPDSGPGVVYLQNASDPIVWWSPELLYRKPAWLDGDRGPDVSGSMNWYPVVTFWQVTVDLIKSTKAPEGHGHSYNDSIADGWAALVAPPDWTDADTARLREAVPDEDA